MKDLCSSRYTCFGKVYSTEGAVARCETFHAMHVLILLHFWGIIACTRKGAYDRN